MTDPCEQMAHLLWQYIDRELDEATAQELRTHMRLCRECGDLHDFECRLRAVIQMKCRGEVCPQDLRHRLLQMLHEF